MEIEEKAELLPAYFFFCPDCGSENYLRVVIRERPDKGKRGIVVMRPKSVRCGECEKVWKVYAKDWK